MKLSKGHKLLILGIALVVIDQVIKVLVKTNMTLGQSFNVLGDWFRIVFVENKGMAFGMAFGGTVGKILLSVFRVVLSAFLIWWVGRLSRREDVPSGVLVGLTLITAGAIGNIVDSLFYGLVFSESTWTDVAFWGGNYAPFLCGKVVDMFYFPLIDTYLPDWMPLVGGKHFTFFDPVFNFADSCVTVGAFYLIIFHWKFFSSLEKK